LRDLPVVWFQSVLIAFLGTPRSGTKWVSAVMRSFGLDVRHETMGSNGTACGFAAWSHPLPITRQDVRGVEFTHRYHLCRDPLATMRTMPEVLATADVWQPWFVANGFHPEGPWDSKLASLRYWVATRRFLIAQGLPVFRVDRADEDWPMVAADLGLGELPEIEPSNKRPPFWTPTWNDLDKVDDVASKAAREIAAVLGYSCKVSM